MLACLTQLWENVPSGRTPRGFSRLLPLVPLEIQTCKEQGKPPHARPDSTILKAYWFATMKPNLKTQGCENVRVLSGGSPVISISCSSSLTSYFAAAKPRFPVGLDRTPWLYRLSPQLKAAYIPPMPLKNSQHFRSCRVDGFIGG